MLFNVKNLIRELDIKLNSKLGQKSISNQKNAIEKWMDKIYANAVSYLTAKSFFFFFRFSIFWMLNFAKFLIQFNIAQFSKTVNNFNFQFSLTIPKVKNLWILKINLICTQISEIANWLNLEYRRLLQNFEYYNRLIFEWKINYSNFFCVWDLY